MQKKLTTSLDTFIERAKEIHGDVYDYSNVIYLGAKGKVEIICKKHGSFWQRASHHTSKTGCKLCKNDEKSQRMTLSQEAYIDDCKKKHGDEYDYSKTVYEHSQKSLIVTCKVHGDFEIHSNNHRNGSKCKLCNNEAMGVFQTSNTTNFIKSAIVQHGNTYDYSLVEYVTSKIKVKIICKDHGEFLQEPSNHLTGCGCPSCTLGGFNNNVPAVFYILNSGNTTKVGITNRDAPVRLVAVNRSSGLDFKVVKEFNLESGYQVKELEVTILKWLRKNYAKETRKFDGYTECFKDVPYEILHQKVAEVLQSITNRA